MTTLAFGSPPQHDISFELVPSKDYEPPIIISFRLAKLRNLTQVLIGRKHHLVTIVHVDLASSNLQASVKSLCVSYLQGAH